MDLLELADRLFTGELPIESHHPFASSGQMAEVQPGLAFVDAFANSAVVDTDDGLVVVDTSGVFHAKARARDDAARGRRSRLDTAIFTHGHIDHVFGVDLYEEEARDERLGPRRGSSRTSSYRERFERYQLTAGYNAVINQRQFRRRACGGRLDYRYPDETYRDTLDVRGRRRAVRAVPRPRRDRRRARGCGRRRARSLFAGDMFIWASPNCGNPQKVQRYARDWAVAFRKMAALEPEVLLPGHGLPIVGADRVRQALDRRRRAARVARSSRRSR